MMRKTVLLITLWLAAAGAPRTASAQMWFEGDYLFWGRANTSDQQYVVGGAASDDADFDFASGFRLGLGSTLGNYEVEAIFSKIDQWEGDGTSALALPLALDGTAGNGIVFPGGAGSLAFTTALGRAASIAAEATESEFLLGGSVVSHAYTSDLRDVQLNFGSNRNMGWFRWGVGYRNILIEENGGVSLFGTFNALDVDDASGPGLVNNDPNDGLANGSLIAAGFTSLTGANGFDSINPLIPSADTLAILMNGSTENRLDGLQLMGAVRTPWNEILTLEGFLRMGLFYNRINGSVSELVVGGGDDDSAYFRTIGDSKSTASFGLNPGIKALFNITDYISLTTGYEFLLLTGIGLGPEQYGQVQTNLLGATAYKVDSSGVFLAHGGNIGIEVRW